MPSLPTYTPSDFVRRVREDFLAHAATHGVHAIYRAGGVGDGVLISGVVVGGKPVAIGPAMGRSAIGAGNSLHKSMAEVQVAAAFATETGTAGVADLGDGRTAVVKLSRGDTLEVHGAEVHLPDQAVVTLRVGDNVQLVDSSYWACTCLIGGAA